MRKTISTILVVISFFILIFNIFIVHQKQSELIENKNYSMINLPCYGWYEISSDSIKWKDRPDTECIEQTALIFSEFKYNTSNFQNETISPEFAALNTQDNVVGASLIINNDKHQVFSFKIVYDKNYTYLMDQASYLSFINKNTSVN